MLRSSSGEAAAVEAAEACRRGCCSPSRSRTRAEVDADVPDAPAAEAEATAPEVAEVEGDGSAELLLFEVVLGTAAAEVAEADGQS